MNFWVFCKVNKLFTRKIAMLEGDAILLENLKLDRHGGIWHLLDEELLERLVLKIGLKEELCIFLKCFSYKSSGEKWGPSSMASDSLKCTVSLLDEGATGAFSADEIERCPRSKIASRGLHTGCVLNKSTHRCLPLLL